MGLPWRDYLELLRTIRWIKLVNAAKVVLSYMRSRWGRTTQMSGLPMAMAIEPTTSCNLRCPECPSGLRSFTRPTGMLPVELFRKTIHELSESLFYLTFYFQGEPYLHPDFLAMVSEAKSKGIYTATSTNAHYLSDDMAKRTVESGLSRLIVSIDGTTQEAYAAYRVGGNLEKVLEGTRRVVAWKKALQSATPHIIFQFLVVRPNEHQIQEVKQLANSLGVNEVRLKTAQIYDYERGSPLIPTQTRYARYEEIAPGRFQIKNKFLDHCWKMWHSCVMTWDGRVVPCCFDKDAHHVMGHLDQTTFREVWHSGPYQDFRRKLHKARSSVEMCKNCTEGTPLWG